MTGDAHDAQPRYWAFISYSHKDAAFGRWLHRRLEDYSLPRRLVGQSTKQGEVPRKLAPIFRDREEFSAATDLTAEVCAALAQSRSLIVVCSPDAAASRWVSREVEQFRALHPDRPILAAIRGGDPAQSFPAALLTTGPAGELIEPLAADFRPRGDGKSLGILKLVAGIAGLRLDELVQRDAQRQRQRVTAITALALAAVLIMGVLTIAAVSARREAERQRSEAEGLVEFMLTDLRGRLKSVGRLDVMTAVNERAFHYYVDQNLSSLPVESLERRARILHAMGEDDEDRGDHRDASLKFREAERTTAELLKNVPNDPERVFDHAQSVYWMGNEDFQQNRFPAAAAAWREYRKLALRMIALSPGNTKYRLELAYADSNLCTLALYSLHDTAGAVKSCGAALIDAQYAATHIDAENKTAEARAEIVNLQMNCLANLSDAHRQNRDYDAARAERRVEETLLDRELANDPKNKDLKDTWIVIQRAYAHIDEEQGRIAEAETYLNRAITAADQMVKFDPSNTQWSELRTEVLQQFAELRQRQQNSRDPQHH